MPHTYLTIPTLLFLIILWLHYQAYLNFFEQLIAPNEVDIVNKSKKLQPPTIENVFTTLSKELSTSTPVSVAPSSTITIADESTHTFTSLGRYLLLTSLFKL